jgi:hypothetical protein
MGGARSMNGEKRNAYGLLVGRTPLGRPRSMWVDNIKMDKLGWCGLDWSCSG